MQQIDDERIIQPLTPKIVEEADRESAKEMDYVKEHMEELEKMTWEERWKVLDKVRKLGNDSF